jgi:ABC-2 type transport system permease protein
MEILLVSPMKPIYIIISKAIPYFVLSLVNLTTILLISVFMLGVPIAGSLFWLIVFSLVYIFVNLSLGLLISSVVNSQLVALLISGMVLMLPVLMLSGMMFPIENMPAFFQWVSQIIPAKWYIIGVKKIMIKGLGISAIIPELSVLMGMGIVIIGLSLKTFKNRLE